MSISKQRQRMAIDAHFAGLHEFAKTYTVATFKTGRTPEKAAKIIRKVDMIGDNEVEKFHEQVNALAKVGKARAIACQKGCAYCCYLRVNSTPLEVIAIWNHIQTMFSPAEKQALEGRIDDFLKAGDSDRVACPLLVDDACSVHEVRPLVCRSYNSTDVEKCRIAFDDLSRESEVPYVPGQSMTMGALRQGLEHGLELAELPSREVRLAAALKLLFEDPTRAERWTAGEDVFAGAEPPVPTPI